MRFPASRLRGLKMQTVSLNREFSMTWRLPRIEVCRDCVYDWSVYGFTRKVLAITALILAGVALSPTYIPAQPPQTALSQKVEDLQSRLDRLNRVPEDVAEIRVEIINLKAGQKEAADKMWWLIAALITAAGAKFLEAFGVKIVKTK